jgi:leucyl-tRNA synthetase
MAQKYEPGVVESKWQRLWAEESLYETDLSPQDVRHNFFNLAAAPCPGRDVHVGHLYAYTGHDVNARYKRARGYNVFFPFGFNSLGVGAENAALERGMHPREWAEVNLKRVADIVSRLGTMIDWRSTLVTHEPEFYKWDQWFFLKMLERQIAYRELAPVDWCPSCRTSLAREQVKGEERVCELCETPVTKKTVQQWKLRLTAYADKLLKGLADVDWPEHLKTAQRAWIGPSRGGNIRFPVQGLEEQIEIFTTRPETSYGATFLVLAPEHPLVNQLTTDDRRAAVEEYKEQASRQSETKRLAADKEKTGVFTGRYAVNPLTAEPIPIWIADYVLLGYGTGAIMAVPAGDQRDLDFARRYGLAVRRVVVPFNRPEDAAAEVAEAYTGPGVMINSGAITGLLTLGRHVREEWGEDHRKTYGFGLDDSQPEAKEVFASILREGGIGEMSVSYRLRDWVISRQRYWGTPIPVVYCASCGTVPVPYDQLPVELPASVNLSPGGQPPPQVEETFRATTCPVCLREAERETDTMDALVAAAWGFCRSLSPNFEEGPFEPRLAGAWLPVRQYVGAPDEALTHLLYARFWTKVMRDLGLVGFDEPFLRLLNQGLILGSDMQKVSSGRADAADAATLLRDYGADILRGYLMFIGPWEQGGPFSTAGVEGIRRFYHRVWDLFNETRATAAGSAGRKEVGDLESLVHQTVERVQNAYDNFSFNVGLAALMEMSNALRELRSTAVADAPEWQEALDAFLLMLAPIAPHLAEELWERRGKPFSVHRQAWPVLDPAKIRRSTFELVIQVNGKLRDRVQAPFDLDESGARELALGSESVRQQLSGREPRKVVYIPGRLVNVVA